MKILFITYEPHPTFRPDVGVLFGKYLPRHGVATDLATDLADTVGDTAAPPAWGGGRALVARVAGGRLRRQLAKARHGLLMLRHAARGEYDAVQVRDLPITAALASGVARRRGIPFFYWMSFPLPESQILRARAIGPRGGLSYLFPLLQGLLGRFALRRFVLPRAAHVFVQSDHMLDDLMRRGVPRERMTAVPMGVDLESVHSSAITASDDPRLRGRAVIVHLGVLERQRSSAVLLDAMARILEKRPDAILVLVGDTDPIAYREELRARVTELGIADAVVWTGWLPPAEGWRYLAAAQVGLSLIPRGELFDCASPTKVIEYLAFGLPTVVNDQPDQAAVIAASGCGVCATPTPEGFAEATLALLADPQQRAEMARRGRAFAASARSYEVIARRVAATYEAVAKQSGS